MFYHDVSYRATTSLCQNGHKIQIPVVVNSRKNKYNIIKEVLLTSYFIAYHLTMNMFLFKIIELLTEVFQRTK